MTEPKYLPSWLFWKLLIPLVAAMFVGGASFVTWSAPKIIAVQEKVEAAEKLDQQIYEELRELRREFHEYVRDQ